jgi:hypothetical protein
MVSPPVPHSSARDRRVAGGGEQCCSQNNAAMQRGAATLGDTRRTGEAVLFVGGSAFAYWTQLERDWAPLPVVNAAFWGSTAQLNAHFERLVTPCMPAVIVYCGGAEELGGGCSAQHVLEGFQGFVRMARASNECRHTPIVFLSMVRALFVRAPVYHSFLWAAVYCACMMRSTLSRDDALRSGCDGWGSHVSSWVAGHELTHILLCRW